MAAHTLYFCAPGTCDHSKWMGEAIGVALSGGLCSSGATVRLQFSGAGIRSSKCCDSSGGQPLKDSPDCHSRHAVLETTV